MEFQLKKKGIAVERRLAPALPPVDANPSHLQQLFVNLLANARDALADWPKKRLVVLSTPAEADVQVLVADSGPGVPEHLRAKTFDPFFTTKDEDHGTGLGLSIRKELESAYGGLTDLPANGSYPIA